MVTYGAFARKEVKGSSLIGDVRQRSQESATALMTILCFPQKRLVILKAEDSRRG